MKQINRRNVLGTMAGATVAAIAAPTTLSASADVCRDAEIKWLLGKLQELVGDTPVLMNWDIGKDRVLRARRPAIVANNIFRGVGVPDVVRVESA